MGPSLPSDIFRLVFGHLDVQDILNARQVCKEFYELSKLRSLWNSLLRKRVINQNIPTPGLRGKSIDSLTAPELEQCFHRALRLRRNWVSESPTVVKQLNLEAIPDTRIVSIHVVPGHENRWIISLSMSYGQHRIFTLRCWDIGRSHPVCLARRELKQLRGIAMNKAISDVGILAVLDPYSFSIEILNIDSQATDQEHGFVTAAAIPEEVHAIHLFSNSSLLTRDGNGALYFWDINSPQSKVELQNPHLQQPMQLLDIIITEGFIMVLKLMTLECYAFPSPVSLFGGSTVLHPVFVYQWPWRIDNAAMILRHRPPRSHARTPISIFIRFGSYFPWAINILHHYEIRPNTHFFKDGPISQGNLPYEFPPVLRETIGSPVRLHATSDMSIGAYGTAVWTDSHTEDYFNHADRGQRLAGRFLPHVVSGEEEEDDEVELSDQVATVSATSVYAYHEEDSWVRVALDETEGRIILGRDDGVISVLEYV
ncbi:hypothetical protein BDZ97DRAFT_1707518 [Flammula alnicola]|nr:hypothetical protein BDZ97DRAFT_1707518 [Flammula alnicola]